MDTAVSLYIDLRKQVARFDRAMQKTDMQAAERAAGLIQSLAGELHKTIPATAEGAAVRLTMAVELVEVPRTEEERQMRDRLWEIRCRAGRGRAREADLDYLQQIADGSPAALHEDILAEFLGHVRAALSGLKQHRSRPSLLLRLGLSLGGL